MKIKIIGLKSREAKKYTEEALVKLCKYTFPEFWEDIF
jgi:hypothetical protein